MEPDYIGAIGQMQTAANAGFNATIWIIVICITAFVAMRAVRGRFDP